MENVLTKRTLLITGKGGVGKTTFAAALARLLASRGKRVLVAEVATDATEPSPLARALGGEVSREVPAPVAPGIRSVVLTPSAGHHRFLKDTLPMRLLADAAMRSAAVRRFLTAAPAFGEMGVLYHMLTLLRQQRPDGTFEHEVCVVDAPATGHALAITQLPESILRIIPGGPIGRAVREGLALLTDPRFTTSLVVTLPETLPVTESLELAAGLIRHNVALAGVVANRVPDDPFSPEERAQVYLLNASAGPLFGARAARRLDRARCALERLRAASTVPVLSVPEFDAEGTQLVDKVAGVLAGSNGAVGVQPGWLG